MSGMRRKRWLAAVMAAALMLGGCQSGGSQDTAQTQEGGTEQTQAQVQESESQDTDVVSLKYLHVSESFDPETDYTRELIRELLNVDIIPEMGNEDDKVNLILSSGQDYDMIKLTNRNLLISYVQNDVIWPLDEYIDQYPDLKNAFTEDEWATVTFDGKIYAIPETNTDDVEWGFAIRKDWLDALGEEMPSTPDDLYRVLKRFKEEDPGNVGTENVIPLTMEGDVKFNGLAQAFGLGESIDSYIEKDGALVPGVEQEGARELVTFLNRLYAEGLLDADYPSNTNETMISKVAAGYAGACRMTPWESAALRTLRENVPDSNLTFLEPFAAEDGSRSIANRSGLKGFLIVPKASDKVAEVVKYCNDFLAEENYTKLIVGEEGVSYTIEDGKYMPILPEFDKFNKGRWFYPTNVGERYTPLFSARAHKEVEMGELWDDINAKCGEYSYDPIMNYAPTMDSETEALKQSLSEWTKEKVIKMIIDPAELENFDSFVAEWKERGGDQLTQAYNEWYQNR
ncbi:MAG TPA: extracellular solute-binding protein [Candidatus Eisenbergiella pullicola]|nr:extracellular solute-binding protein [Candidatus Eisenbergiella pullicola]